MGDAIYKVMRQLSANDPYQKEMYRVDRPHKDHKPNLVDDDDAKEGKSQKQVVESYTGMEEETEHKETSLSEQPKGKGKYLDKDGNEHLDIFV